MSNMKLEILLIENKYRKDDRCIFYMLQFNLCRYIDLSSHSVSIIFHIQ